VRPATRLYKAKKFGESPLHRRRGEAEVTEGQAVKHFAKCVVFKAVLLSTPEAAGAVSLQSS
jgi:hypothetical protein